ncbi:MAG TPA: ribonuclease P protein component [Holophagaceae bacterium]|nr:ribonuclease P protein component [Holophagaceae bacterium]
MRSLLGRDPALDVRIFPGPAEPPAPRLLVNAPRRAGSAVKRNRFRRRVRMAFLKLIREEAFQVGPGQIVWVRPGASGCDLPFEALMGLLHQALDRQDSV